MSSIWSTISVFSLLALPACDAGIFEQPYKQTPQLTQVQVTIVWTDAAEIRKRCASNQAYACATIATQASPYSTIYAIRPRSFTHAPLVEALGHELLHSLGAMHE